MIILNMVLSIILDMILFMNLKTKTTFKGLKNENIKRLKKKKRKPVYQETNRRNFWTKSSKNQLGKKPNKTLSFHRIKKKPVR